MRTPEIPLTPEQEDAAERLYQTLRSACDDDLRQLARLLASKPDDKLLGKAEFEVRDRVHRIGAMRAAVSNYFSRVARTARPSGRRSRKRRLVVPGRSGEATLPRGRGHWP